MTTEDLITKIEKAIIGCKKCRLYKNATKAVPGYGNPKAKIVFIGEAPGYNEDQQGLPFVGRAGKLLDLMLKTVRMERSDIWIGNIIKHRPPENRDPLPNEIESYGKYLDQIIDIIDPKVIITLGRFSMNKFLPEVFISQVHGKEHEVTWNGKKITVVPMYHPAASLRNGKILEAEKQDFIHLKDVIMWLL